jgi:outer membrane biosynthesis protein TonB
LSGTVHFTSRATVSRTGTVNALTANLDPTSPTARPLWAAAALSLAAHVALLAALGSVVSTAWRNADLAAVPGSGTPLQAWLVPRTAEPDPEPPPPEPPVEVVPAPPPPPTAQPAPPAPAVPTPMPPGLTQPGSGGADAPRPPPQPPADIGDIAVGATTDLAPFGLGTALRLGALHPIKPGRLPRLARPLSVTYPEWALRDRTNAHVDVLLLLDAKGAVVETVVAPDDPIFAPAVREALAGATFVPAQSADTPMPYWIALEFVFTIDPAKPAAGR